MHVEWLERRVIWRPVGTGHERLVGRAGLGRPRGSDRVRGCVPEEGVHRGPGGLRSREPRAPSLTLSFDASSALRTQIEQGAPADVFASADTANPQKLVDGGFATGAVTNFAGNTLTVIVPASNPGGVATPADLAKAGLKIVAAGDDVPITKYANQLIDNLASEAGYPADFGAKVRANIVSEEDNVAAVVAKIELGEGDAAIVYVTDASNSTKVTAVAVPDAANVPATYGAVAVRASHNPEAAAAFIAWLAGPDGQAILAKYGFRPPS